jgi:hypothetical protein
MLNEWRKQESKLLVKDLVDEYNGYGKTELQKTLEQNDTWRTEMLGMSDTLGEALGYSSASIKSFVNTIADRRQLDSVKQVWGGFLTNVKDLATSIRTSAIGTPVDQFGVIQGKAFDYYNRVKSGDIGAQDKFLTYANQYVDKIQELYGSSDYGNGLINQVLSALDSAPDPASLSTVVTSLSELPAGIGNQLQNTPLTLSAGTVPVFQNGNAALEKKLDEMKSAYKDLLDEVKKLRADAQKQSEAEVGAVLSASSENAEKITTALTKTTERVISAEANKPTLA